MSTTSKSEAYDQVDSFLMEQFPQIVMHGGESVITELDSDTGEVEITLTDACHGCNISGMTSKSLVLRLQQNIEWITKVNVVIKDRSEIDQL